MANLYGSSLRNTASRRLAKSGLCGLPDISLQIRLSSTAVARERHATATIAPSGTAPRPLLEAPLATMPASMLLRSLFIATISSNKFLLIPSLKLLSFFSKEGRSFFFNVERNPVLHAVCKRTFYNQFCAGESVKDTNACVRQLKDLGFKGVILTYAKELVYDWRTNVEFRLGDVGEKLEGDKTKTKVDADIESWRVGTLKTVDLIAEGDILALKMSGAGPAVAHAFTNATLPSKQMLSALDEIAQTCKNRGIQIIVDAESQHFQHGINKTALEMMRKFNHEKTVVIYNTYQAYLKSTSSVIEKHLAEAEKDGFTLGLKLVRGAYILSDDRSLIHDTKQETDDAYNAISQGAIRKQIGEFGGSRPFPALNLFLASHNRESVLAARRLHIQRENAGLPTVPVAYGQLHGMSDELSFSLLQEKAQDGASPDVFKCSTWGSMGDCMGYLLRRAVENRDSVLRTRDEFLALRKELGRRIRAVFSS